MRPLQLGRWIAAVSIAEALGFAFPIGLFAVLELSGTPPLLTWVAVALAGAVEGALLGAGQAWAAGLPRRPWVVATALAAVFAWAIGMAPSSLNALGVLDLETAPLSLLLPTLILGGGALLASIPLAQWLVLRRLLPRAWRWIPISALAWLLALPWTMLVGLLFDETTPFGWVLLCFALAGALMALTVATLTGLGLRAMTKRPAEAGRAR